MMTQIYHLRWTGIVKPKARPRVTSRGTFMPPEYKAMKSAAVRSFSQQWESIGQATPIDHQVRCYMVFRGKHSRACDYVDNAPGTLYDALVEASVLTNDNGLHSPGGVHDLEYSKSPPIVDILIAPWLPFKDSIGQMYEISEWIRSN